ncbi:lipase [Plakobranchus ocellatus]|uniref:Lipase n=1 Tax=Plakobranchus ocellatus TaxID=259542 RepID=A0AAV3YEH1_9GAST|nr:lipase [Plakobranchus ocellatus]
MSIKMLPCKFPLHYNKIVAVLVILAITAFFKANCSLIFQRERNFDASFDSTQINLLELLNFKEKQATWNNNANSKRAVNPDALKNLTELIRGNNYPVEVYTVKTADGFLLDLHRIPHGRKHLNDIKNVHQKPKNVVYLQHALLSSACDWVMNYANDSLGFILADQGYDVWMGNTRGNTYSRRHASLSPDDPKFWDWSFDEMAKYDMPAFIDFILTKTGQPSLSLIGHSQGTMMNFALFSERPDMEKKVKIFIALAPVAFVESITSPIKYLSLMSDDEIYSHFGKKIFLPNDNIVKFFVDLFCTEVATKWMCDDILFLFVGVDFKNLNQSRLDVYFHHSPSGVSVKDLVHFAQLYRQRNFVKYNYGSSESNMLHYNQTTPPEYNIDNITVPVVFFSGGDDWLSDPLDVRHLVHSLHSLQAWYMQPTWNHMDFVWGLTAAEGCYKKVLESLQRYNH